MSKFQLLGLFLPKKVNHKFKQAIIVFAKTPFKDYFGPELRQNLIQRFGGLRISQEDAILEGKMYAIDMYLEFQRQSGGLLSIEWVLHISSEVYNALNEYVFDIHISKGEFSSSIMPAFENPETAQQSVNTYYNRI